MATCKKSTVLALALFTLMGQGLCQTIQGRLDLVQAIDQNDDGVVDVAEVENFYATFPGVDDSVTRCDFQQRMVGLGTSAMFASALFDFLQRPSEASWMDLTLDEWVIGMLGQRYRQTDEVVYQIADSQLEQRLRQLYRRIQTAMQDPSSTTEGQNGIRWDAFNVQQLTNQADANGDGEISRSEMSAIMRSLDANNDFGVQRCEFVNGMMTRFSQQPLSANRMFDLLFKSNEITWADVDTIFLMRSINGNYLEITVPSGRYEAYMSELNSRAAGIITVASEIVTTGPGDHASTLTSQFHHLILAVIVAMFSVRL